MNQSEEKRSFARFNSQPRISSAPVSNVSSFSQVHLKPTLSTFLKSKQGEKLLDTAMSPLWNNARIDKTGLFRLEEIRRFRDRAFYFKRPNITVTRNSNSSSRTASKSVVVSALSSPAVDHNKKKSTSNQNQNTALLATSPITLTKSASISENAINSKYEPPTTSMLTIAQESPLRRPRRNPRNSNTSSRRASKSVVYVSALSSPAVDHNEKKSTSNQNQNSALLATSPITLPKSVSIAENAFNSEYQPPRTSLLTIAQESPLPRPNSRVIRENPGIHSSHEQRMRVNEIAEDVQKWSTLNADPTDIRLLTDLQRMSNDERSVLQEQMTRDIERHVVTMKYNHMVEAMQRKQIKSKKNGTPNLNNMTTVTTISTTSTPLKHQGKLKPKPPKIPVGRKRTSLNTKKQVQTAGNRNRYVREEVHVVNVQVAQPPAKGIPVLVDNISGPSVPLRLSSDGVWTVPPRYGRKVSFGDPLAIEYERLIQIQPPTASTVVRKEQTDDVE